MDLDDIMTRIAYGILGLMTLMALVMLCYWFWLFLKIIF
jgi:uncharacterized membrane protein YuzA (DUF378 family)